MRVTALTLGGTHSEWNVFGVRRDTLLLLRVGANGGPRTDVALADVTRLEVNRGPKRNALVGAVTGLALGAATGALYGTSHPGPLSGLSCLIGCTEEEIRRAQSPAPGFWAAVGAMAGAPLGALVGRYVAGDYWQQVVPGPTRLSVVPSGGSGVRIALAVRAP